MPAQTMVVGRSVQQGSQRPAPQGAQGAQGRQDMELVPLFAPNRPVAPQLDPRQRDTLIVAHLPLVHAIARRIHSRLPRSVMLEDLVPEGYVGLIEAIDRYDECRRVPLRLFARRRVTGAILDLLRNLDWAPRSVRRRAEVLEAMRDRLHRRLGRKPEATEVAGAMDLTVAEYNRYLGASELRRVVSLDTPISNDNPTPAIDTLAVEDDPTQHRQTRELTEALYHAVSRLPAKERDAVQGYYLDERPLVEVGAEMGVSESRASQLHRTGVGRLRFKIREHLGG
jgi:RNA polymerase sigma factor for flagellar operon FliA